MNLSHLSHEVETLFERLGDHGVRSACTPFLIYRRTRHELGLDGLSAAWRWRPASPRDVGPGRALLRRAVLEPGGGLQAHLARPGTRDEYSACVGRELRQRPRRVPALLAARQRLPPTSMGLRRRSSRPRRRGARRARGRRRGPDEFLEQNAVILLADHAQTRVEHLVPLAEALGLDWRVLEPNESAEPAELAVSRIVEARAGAVYVPDEGRRAEGTHASACGRACARSRASTCSPGSPATRRPSSATGRSFASARDRRPATDAAAGTSRATSGPPGGDPRRHVRVGDVPGRALPTMDGARPRTRATS